MKRLVILGGGESGAGAAKLGKKLGYEVFLSDKGKLADKYKRMLEELGVEYEEGQHSEERIFTADLVVKSPGIPDKLPMIVGLREKGIEVIPHFLKEECDAMNHVFFHYIRTGTPYVAMKYAMTMDGKIACYTGDSKWVTGEESRAHVQTLRNHYKGIMAGIGTVLADDPMLNCRIEGGRDPIRIITDSHLRIPMDSQLVRTAGQQPLIVACLPDADEEKAAQLQEKGVEVLRIPGVTTADITEEQKEVISLPVLMKELGARKIDGILLEGGGQLNESALQAGIVDRIYCYIAPKIFGGAQAKTPVEGQGLTRAADAWQFNRIGMQEFGQDILLEYEKAQELQ